jgi:hypothetical protein
MTIAAARSRGLLARACALPCLVLLLVLAWPRTGRAAGDGSERETPIPLTVVDLPFNAGMGWPSMRQSLDLGYAATRLPTWGVVRGFDRVRNPELRLGLGLMTVYAVNAPLILVSAWMHEEWHRAVLSHQRIGSRNGIYHPSAWSNGLISVDRVADEDLARLKAEHPADTVRLMMAGLEAQDVLARRIGDHAFVYGDRGVWPGGRLAATMRWRALPGASLDLSLDGKTAGYVPGNVFLEPNLSVRLGATVRL